MSEVTDDRRRHEFAGLKTDPVRPIKNWGGKSKAEDGDCRLLVREARTKHDVPPSSQFRVSKRLVLSADQFGKAGPKSA